MAQQVKDQALLLLWLGSLLWYGFNPWPGNFHMPWAQPKKKKGIFDQAKMSLAFPNVFFLILYFYFLYGW